MENVPFDCLFYFSELKLPILCRLLGRYLYSGRKIYVSKYSSFKADTVLDVCSCYVAISQSKDRLYRKSSLTSLSNSFIPKKISYHKQSAIERLIIAKEYIGGPCNSPNHDQNRTLPVIYVGIFSYFFIICSYIGDIIRYVCTYVHMLRMNTKFYDNKSENN